MADTERLNVEQEYGCDGNSFSRSPHPHDVRALRVRLGAPMEAVAKAAGYQTKRSWWLAERGELELPAWRWAMVQAAALQGGIARSGRAAGKTNRDVVIRVDEMRWADADDRMAVAQSIICLMDLSEVSLGELAERSGVSPRMLALILTGKAGKQTTAERVEAVLRALQIMRTEGRAAVLAFRVEARETPAALRALRKGLRIAQGKAGAWATPTSISPAPLMSGYECETVGMPAEAATRLASALMARAKEIESHPGWAVIEAALKRNAA